MIECTCKECGKVFTVPYKCNIKDYCSKSCAQKVRWRNAERKVKEFTCETCGKVFYIPTSDHRIKEGKKIRFCSHKCCGEANKKGSIIKCKQCGKEFYSTKNVFCSQDCVREYRKSLRKVKEV